MSKKGILYGVGVGPGDPELLTVKAVKVLEKADVVAYFSKEGNKSNARKIVEPYIRPGMIELPLPYPLTIEENVKSDVYQEAIGGFFEQAAGDVARYLDEGKSVAVLSAGDPFLFGSYMHLHIRLCAHYEAEVIPGITAMSGCWALANTPIAQGDDVLSIMTGILSEEALTRHLRNVQAAVIMKVGRNLPKIRRALEAAGKLNDAVYVERGTMSNNKVIPLKELEGDNFPYFSLILVPGWKAKP
jgi:precorrin-2 C20-methyltransferase